MQFINKLTTSGTQMSVNSSARRALSALPTACALASAMLAAAPACATENSQVRALLGAPSYELTTPQFPGVYGAIWVQHYTADKLRDEKGDNALAPSSFVPTGLPASLPATVQQTFKLSADVVVPRITYISEQIVADGRLGFSASMPMVRQRTEVGGTVSFTPGTPQIAIDAVTASLAAQAAENSGEESGLADTELTAFVDWAQDESRVVAGLAVVAPTGDYEAGRAVNIGAGKFWTLRPLIVASRVWENGLELGLRATYSFNTKNKDTDVTSGQYLHADWAAMYRATDSWRLGVQGYALTQTTKDKGPDVAEHGNKVRTFAAGPVVGYLAESGTWGIDFKVMQEFEVRNRPEGQVYWLRLNVRLD
jgi:hypothetical protein